MRNLSGCLHEVMVTLNFAVMFSLGIVREKTLLALLRRSADGPKEIEEDMRVHESWLSRDLVLGPWGIQSKRPQVKTSPNLRSQNVPRRQAKTSPGQKPLTLVFTNKLNCN
jgi:hypothetical protein